MTCQWLRSSRGREQSFGVRTRVANWFHNPLHIAMRKTYDRTMEREVVHLSPAEAIRDIAAILERVEQGAEVVAEKDRHPVVVTQPAPRPGRLLSECIALAEAHGSTVTLDEGFS